MRKFERKQKNGRYKDILFSVPFIIVLGIICSLSISATWDVYKKVRNTEKNVAAVAETYDELKKRESDLEGKIDSLETPLGVETEIREKFGLVKDGEEMIVIVDPPKEEEKNNLEETEDESLWKKIKDWF